MTSDPLTHTLHCVPLSHPLGRKPARWLRSKQVAIPESACMGLASRTICVPVTTEKWRGPFRVGQRWLFAENAFPVIEPHAVDIAVADGLDPSRCHAHHGR